MPVNTTHSDTNLSVRPKPSRKGGWRLYAVGALLAVGAIGVVGRLFLLQVVRGDEYAALARKQYESKAPLQADRGAILDRNGTLLATNVPAVSFAVDPKHVKEPDLLAQTFAEEFGGDVKSWKQKITAKKTSFIWIKRKVVGEAINRIKTINDPGLITVSEPLRRFEYGSFGSQIVGCVNLDNNGLSGVELFYDEALRGQDGYMVMQRDARGERRPDVDLPRLDPEHGETLQLTIDITMQSIVEDELAHGVKEADAASGTAIALDPKTGEVLAMASLPSFDPNNPSEATPSNVRPRSVTDTYEPGSTIKGITAAAALEEGLVTVDEMIDGEGGEFALPDGHIVRDDHALGLVSFADAFRWSSNVIFAKVASRLDPSSFYRYVRDFGFGISTGIDLPGEVRGEVKKPEDFSEETQAFMAYGYQLAVTPLQLAVAYGAIANGGVLMRPHTLKRRIAADGEVLEEVEPQELRRVISEETALKVREMLTDVVANGTGRAAQARSIRVAGKTGTAQILHEGSYTANRYNASFVGFFPAEDPEIVLLVLLNEPKNGYYGGQVAAPIFASIARRIINATMVHEEPILRQVSTESADSIEIPETAVAGGTVAPDLRGLNREGAVRLALAHRLKSAASGEGERVLRQQPAPGEIVRRGDVLYLDFGDTTSLTLVPDVRGMTIRRALALLNEFGLSPRIAGSGGVVREQHPSPGTHLKEKQSEIQLQCR
ncbi:MAG: penicillin-binding transpeptidase domain-containing protein [Candidatus Kapaibacterium sp.]